MKTKQQRRDEAYKKYKAVKNRVWKKYLAVVNPALKKYKAVVNPAWDKYLTELEKINEEQEEIPEEIIQNGVKYRRVK